MKQISEEEFRVICKLREPYDKFEYQELPDCHCDELKERVQELEKQLEIKQWNMYIENRELRRALKFYANPDNYVVFEVADQAEAITEGGISKAVTICAEQALGQED